MNNKVHNEKISKELEKLSGLLSTSLDHYGFLIKKDSITSAELEELGDLEYFLIELNMKISELKKKLEHNLFGISLDLYYKLKKKALEGDVFANKKIATMKKSFDRALKGSDFINWN